jgi:sodium/proline symporter
MIELSKVTEVTYSSAIFLGIYGKVLFSELLTPNIFTQRQQNACYLFFLTAFIITSLLAAIMSTISSQLIVAASAIAHDICSKIMTSTLNTSQVLSVSRLTIFFIGLGVIFIALNDTDMVF